MRAVIVIPARHASGRFPGKPLAQLRLPGGARRSLIRLTWEAAQAVPGIAAVLVATDDARIRTEAESFGAKVVMTSPECRNGTERCAQAVATAGVTADLVINLQGDSPLTPPDFVRALVDALRAGPDVPVATPVLRVGAHGLAMMREDRQAGRIGATTAVFDRQHDALYFSKEILPYLPAAGALPTPLPVFHHIGLYAYRPTALARYVALPPAPLERAEGLEQLRFLENGMAIRCVEVAARGRVLWEVNNPADISRIEAALAEGP